MCRDELYQTRECNRHKEKDSIEYHLHFFNFILNDRSWRWSVRVLRPGWGRASLPCPAVSSSGLSFALNPREIYGRFFNVLGQLPAWQSAELGQKAWVLAHLTMWPLAEHLSLSFSTGNVEKVGSICTSPWFDCPAMRFSPKVAAFLADVFRVAYLSYGWLLIDFGLGHFPMSKLMNIESKWNVK